MERDYLFQEWRYEKTKKRDLLDQIYNKLKEGNLKNCSIFQKRMMEFFYIQNSNDEEEQSDFYMQIEEGNRKFNFNVPLQRNIRRIIEKAITELEFAEHVITVETVLDVILFRMNFFSPSIDESVVEVLRHRNLLGSTKNLSKISKTLMEIRNKITEKIQIDDKFETLLDKIHILSNETCPGMQNLKLFFNICFKDMIVRSDEIGFLDVLGEGSNGKVHAIDKNGTYLAMKIIEIKGWDKDQFIELSKSYKIWKKEIVHPNILAFYGVSFDITEKNIHVFTELCNETLFEFYPKLFDTPDYPKIIENIIEQIINSVEYLHQLKIIHRDLKSSKYIVY